MEAAGLALGLFPLVMKGITLYIDSTEEIIEMVDHKPTLDKFKRELGVEKSIYDNIWYELGDRTGVFVEPNNVEPSPDIINEVLSCLRPHSIKSFRDACSELDTILRELTEKFQKYEQNLVGMDYILARVHYSFPVNKAGYRKMFIMFQHFKKKTRDECIDRIHRINTNLERIMNGAPQTSTVKANKLQKDVTRHYQRVRTHAIILYEALSEGLRMSRCPCKVHTSVHLLYDSWLFPPLTWMRRCIKLFYNWMCVL